MGKIDYILGSLKVMAMTTAWGLGDKDSYPGWGRSLTPGFV